MSIPAALWPEVSRLLDEALNLEPSRRAAWLAGLDAARPELGVPLRELLAALDRPAAADPLRGPPTGLIARALAEASGAAAPLQAGQRFGPYRLVEALGEGGMASVWLAEQTVNVIRRVALKLPHRGLEAADAARQRFERERDLLAGLEHTHIARLYDAGVTPDGQPYLAMEWITGRPITRWCDERRLGVDARLALFAQVLEAVGHAHARLVIHRDLKVSNILVADSGEVKLLDFGVANLLREQAAPGVSEALTPETASPEQLAGATLGTASDVYSLGVVLHELLCGCRPYALDRDGPDLHAQLLAAQVPKASEAPFGAAQAGARATSVAGLRRRLRGELDAIVARAMARSVEARYPGVEAFAADLGREMRREPVLAVGSDAPYRLRRFLARRRWQVGAAAALLLALAGGAAGIAWQARAERLQAARSDRVKAFMLSIFESADVDAGANRGTTALALLEQSRGRIDAEFAADPAVGVELQTALAASLMALGEANAAREAAERAVATARRQLGPDDPRTFAAMGVDGRWLLANGKDVEAEPMLAQALAGLRRGTDVRALVATVQAMSTLRYDQGRYAESLDFAREAVRLADSPRNPADSATRYRAWQALGAAMRASGLGGRTAVMRHALDLAQGSSGGQLTVPVLDARAGLAETQSEEGDPDAALAALKSVVADLARLLGERHPKVTETMSSLAIVEYSSGDVDAAAATQRELLRLDAAAGRAESGEDWMSLGQYLLAAHRDAESLEAQRRALELVRAAMGPDHVYVAALHAGRAVALARLARTEEADREVAGLVPAAQSNGSVRFWLASCLAEVRSLEGRHDEALALAREARLALGDTPSRGQMLDAEVDEGEVRAAAGRASDAVPELESAVAALRERHRHGSIQLADALLALGRAHLALGDAADAVRETAESLHLWTAIDPRRAPAAQVAAWHMRALAATRHQA